VLSTAFIKALIELALPVEAAATLHKSGLKGNHLQEYWPF
jgi:hypothetical protein